MIVTDIICTTYNAAATISATVNSIKAQTNPDWRLLIWDDGSTDATPDIVMQEGRADKRIVLLGHEKIGRARALNKALARVATPIFLNIDADDLAHPERLRLSLLAMHNHPYTAVLCTQSVRFFGQSDIEWPMREFQDTGPLPVRPLSSSLLLRNVIDHSSIAANTDEIRAAGGYNENQASQIDYELWLRLQKSGRKLAMLQLPLSGKRLHENQSFESRMGYAYVRSSLALQWRYIRQSNHFWRYVLPFASRAAWLTLPAAARRKLRKGVRITAHRRNRLSSSD